MQRVLQRFNVLTHPPLQRFNAPSRLAHWGRCRAQTGFFFAFQNKSLARQPAVAALRPNGSLHFERLFSAHQPAVAARRPGGARELPGRPADRPIPELRAGGGAGLHHHTCSTSENSTCSSTQRQRHQRHHQAPAPTPFVKHGLRATEMKSLPRLCCDQFLRRQNIACYCIQWP